VFSSASLSSSKSFNQSLSAHPLHCIKYSSVSELFEFASIGADCDSYYDSNSNFDVDSEFDSLGVVPYGFDVT